MRFKLTKFFKLSQVTAININKLSYFLNDKKSLLKLFYAIKLDKYAMKCFIKNLISVFLILTK